jgi:hypothetical protein
MLERRRKVTYVRSILAEKYSGEMLGVKYVFVPVSIGVALALLSACAGRPLQGVLVPVARSAEGTSRVQVLAATTR